MIDGTGSAGRTSVALDRAAFAVLGLFAFSLSVGIALTQVSLFVAILLWLAKCAVERRWLGSATPLDRWIGLFLAACVLATVFSPRPAESAIALKKFYLVAPVYLLAYALKDLRQVRLLVGLFLSGAALTVAYGLVKFFVRNEPRLLGTQTMALTSGDIYMMAGLLALALLVSAPGRRLPAAVLAAASALIAAGLLLTKAVSSWASWLAGAVALFWHRRWVVVLVLVAVIAVVGVFALQRAALADFLTVDKSGSWQVRTNLWRMGWKLFRERPLTGFGMISLQDFYHDVPYDNPHWQEAVRTGHLHNNFIQLAVTTGLIGLAAFILMWVAVFRVLAAAVRGAGPTAKPYAVGFLACAIGFMINGLAEFNFGDSEPTTIIWFIVGLALASQRLAAAQGPGDGPRPVTGAA